MVILLKRWTAYITLEIGGWGWTRAGYVEWKGWVSKLISEFNVVFDQEALVGTKDLENANGYVRVLQAALNEDFVASKSEGRNRRD